MFLLENDQYSVDTVLRAQVMGWHVKLLFLHLYVL